MSLNNAAKRLTRLVRWFSPKLAVLLSLGAAMPTYADYVYVPTEESADKLTIREAQRIITNIIKGCVAENQSDLQDTAVRFTPDFVETAIKTKWIVRKFPNGLTRTLPFRRMSEIQVYFEKRLANPDRIWIRVIGPFKQALQGNFVCVQGGELSFPDRRRSESPCRCFSPVASRT